MAVNPASYAADYVRTLDKPSPYDDGPRSFTIREHRQRNVDNPDTDYIKLLVMVAGAVIAGYAYDQYKNRRYAGSTEFFQE